jgi:hypothetical protein
MQALSRDKVEKEDESLQHWVDPPRFKRQACRQDALVFGGTR